MSDIIVSSIITGSLYTLTALGLVAVYKTTRVFNFAHGLMSAFSAYVGYQLAVHRGWSFVAALAGGILVGAAIGLIAERLILSRLYQRTPLELVIATFGISLILEFGIIRIWGHEERTIPVPFGGRSAEVAGINVPLYGLSVVVISALIVIALTIVLLRTDIGLRLRAMFDDPVAARLMGVNVNRVRALAWTVGGALAGAAGVLLTPILFLTPSTMLVILITAFAAAVIGGFNSFHGSLAGGLIVALTLNVGGAYVSLRFRNIILYGLIVLFLWFRPHGLFGTEESEHAEPEGERAGRILALWQSFLGWLAAQGAKLRTRVLRGHAPQWGLHAGLIVLVFLAQPLFGARWTLSLTSWLVNFVAVAGLALIMFYGGQFSLAQNGFMAIGAYGMAIFLGSAGLSWPVALVATCGVAFVLALLFAIPSARVKGAYFAALTLAVGLALPELGFKWTSVTGGANGLTVPKPTLGASTMSSSAYYFLVAVVATLVFVALMFLRNSPMGKRMVAARDHPRGAETVGISPYAWQVAIISIGCALGGLAGAMKALQTGFVAPTSFQLELALMLFVATVIGGSMTGAFWGAGVITLVPVIFRGVQEWSIALFGIVLIAALFLLPQDMSVADVLRKHRTVGAPSRLARKPVGSSPQPVPAEPESTG